MKRIFMIHGWEGKPNDHWRPWLKEKLQSEGHIVMVPQMPGAKNPKLSEWLDVLYRIVGTPDKNTFFVGHSLGCIAVCRYLESLASDARAGGCVFVAGFSKDFGYPELKEFVSLPPDFEKIKNHTKNFVCIVSDNDEDVPLVQAMEFSDFLSAKLIVEKNKGHFCKSDGVVELPAVLESLHKMM